MIYSEFVICRNKIHAFSVKGHSGFAEAPGDILCASVSAMTLLTLNTLQEVFGAELNLKIDEKKPLIDAKIVSFPQEKEEAVFGVVKGFFIQLQDLEKQYPEYLSVRIQKE